MIVYYFLILIMPLSQHRLWGQIAGDVTGIKFIGLACLPYSLYYLMSRRSPPAFFATLESRLFVVLFCIATVSFVVVGQIPLGSFAMSHWTTYLSLLLLFFITVIVVDSLDRVRWVLLSASASLALASLYVLRDWQQGHNLYVDYRPGYVVGDPNYFTVNILLFLPTTLLLAQNPRPRWQRWFCLGCFIVTLFGVWVSASRGGFLGILACVLTLILRSKQRFRNLALIAVAFALVTAFSPVSPIHRFRNPLPGDVQSADTHVALMHAGVRMMFAYPIFGVGLDNFPFHVRQFVTSGEAEQMDKVFRVAHNSYVEIGAEMGIPALLVFLGMLASSLLSLEQVARRSKRLGIPTLPDIALGLQAGLIGSCVSIFFVSGEYQKMFWISLFLTMCLPPLVDQIERKQRALRRRANTQLSAKSPRVFEVVASSSHLSAS